MLVYGFVCPGSWDRVGNGKRGMVIIECPAQVCASALGLVWMLGVHSGGSGSGLKPLVEHVHSTSRGRCY